MDISTLPKNMDISDDYVRAVKQVKRDFLKAAKDQKKKNKELNPDYEGNWEIVEVMDR